MGSKKVGGLLSNPSQHQQDLAFLKELLEYGKVMPVIERRYALSETTEAIRYLEEGHARGKIVITV
jgi:NADPH:quinone reductase-like Zn-dependent oxidoreductase